MSDMIGARRVTIRITDKQYNYIKEQMDQTGNDLSSIIRLMITRSMLGSLIRKKQEVGNERDKPGCVPR